MNRYRLNAAWVLLGLLGGCAEAPVVPDKPATAVQVQSVGRSAEVLEARYSGTLDPVSKVDVAFRASGYVDTLGRVGKGKASRPYDTGDFVKKGTVLARIRSADYSQKVASATARRAEARASATLAEQELARSQRLFDSKVVSRAELDARIAQRDAAIASVEAAAAQVSEASLALDDTTLVAPSDGVILERNIEEGALANPGSVAFVLADVTQIKVVFGAPQEVASALRVGDVLAVRFDGRGEEAAAPRELEAPIDRIAPAADQKGRLFTVEASLSNADGTLLAGSVVSVRVPKSTRIDDSLIVPLRAVVRSPDHERGFSVFVVDGSGERGPARRREVELGEVAGNGVRVESGLARGDRVVVAGANRLVDGSEVVVLP